MFAVWTCGLLAVATLGTSAEAQYYYQPPPSYYHNDTAEGAVVGGGVGAITGALVAGRKKSGAGALIGAGVGAVTGGLIGKANDKADERQVAAGAAVVSQANAQAAAQAVTNFDLVEMTRAGVGEDLIISSIRSRGCRMDLSPAGLIALKQSGVSDRVVLAAQSMAPGGYATPAPAVAAPYSSGPTVVYDAPIAVVAPPPVYYVRPRPAVEFYFGPTWGGGGYYHHHSHHGHW